MKPEEIKNTLEEFGVKGTLELIRRNMNSHYTSEICVDGVWYSRDTAIKVLLDKVIDIL
jgi:hypothetical protein